MLAKNVGIEMDSARAILQLQKSASEEELLATLQRTTDQRLKFLCNESAVKSSGIKTEIVGRLITSCNKLCYVQTECAGDEQLSLTTSNDVQGTLKSPQTVADSTSFLFSTQCLGIQVVKRSSENFMCRQPRIEFSLLVAVCH